NCSAWPLGLKVALGQVCGHDHGRAPDRGVLEAAPSAGRGGSVWSPEQEVCQPPTGAWDNTGTDPCAPRGFVVPEAPHEGRYFTPACKGTEWDETDSEFLERRQHFFFR